MAEKLELIEDIWNTIPENSDEFTLSEEHAEIIVDRLRDHRANPAEGDSWESVKKRILASR